MILHIGGRRGSRSYYFPRSSPCKYGFKSCQVWPGGLEIGLSLAPFPSLEHARQPRESAEWSGATTVRCYFLRFRFPFSLLLAFHRSNSSCCCCLRFSCCCFPLFFISCLAAAKLWWTQRDELSTNVDFRRIFYDSTSFKIQIERLANFKI